MSDTQHDAFISYYDRIILPADGYHALRKLRNRVRVAVHDYFRDILQLPVPAFATQGSYLMRTIVKPETGGNDIDDGVYLSHLPDDRSAWPEPAETLELLARAVNALFPAAPEIRRACVVAKAPDGNRVDLPVFTRLGGKPFVADTGADGWHKSDTVELSEWFVKRFAARGEQLRRIVHYIKGWTATAAHRYELPSNLILTLYAAEEYVPASNDAEAFTATAGQMARRINVSYELKNPMEPAELMTRRLTGIQEKDGRTAITELAETARIALATGDGRIWRQLLGSRFPL